MASPSSFNPMGTGPQGFVPDPQSHNPGLSTNQPLKGGIVANPDDAENQKPLNDRFLEFTKSKWPTLRMAYSIFHQLVWQDILFYVGELWIQYDSNRRMFSPAEPEDEYTPQPKVNYYAPAADAVCSIFSIPEVECVPKNNRNTSDSHDVAEVANILAQEFKVRNGLSGSKDNEISVGDRAGQFFVQAGNIFGFVTKRKRGTYDKPLFDSIPMTGVRCPQCDTVSKVPPDDPMLQPPPPSPGDMLMGQPVNGPGITPGQPPFQPPCPTCANPLQTYPTTEQKQRIDIKTGRPVTESIIQWDAEFKLGNPLYALPRAGSKSMKEARHFMWAERMTIDEIYEKWGYDAQPDNQFLDAMESSWEIALSYFYTGFANITEGTKDSALVLWMYLEPGKSKAVPEGGVGVLVGEQLINYEPWDEATVGGIGHPVSHACYLDALATFMGRSVMFDVANHQKELNRYESIIALHGMTQASDSVVIDENTKVSEITGRGDRVVYWRSIGPGSREPHRMQHGSLDAGIYEQRQHLEDNIQNITGAVNVWRGKQAGSVTASGAISQLRGQAEQMFNKPTSNWNSFWAEQCRKGVKVMQAVMTIDQITALLGANNIIKAQKFKSAQLDDLLDWKAGGHGMPRTRDERKEELLTLFDRGMLDVSDPNVQQDINDLFGDTGLKQMFNKDATRARWENVRMMVDQQPVQFMPDVEDLSVHMFIHSEAIKELDFDTLPEPIKQMMYEHFLVTKQAYTQQVISQQRLEIQTKETRKGADLGAPGEPSDEPPGAASGPGAPSGGHSGGPGERGGPASGTPGKAGGKTFQSAGQRKTNQPNSPTGPPKK